jgi:methanogenic corrinoid protein MtbC1
MLRWLKGRIDEGLTISQAIALWQHQETEQAAQTLPVVDHNAEERTDLSGVRQALVAALLDFDESRADQVLGEAFASYGLETASERVIAPVMVQIGERWHRGKASTAAEHFASNYLRRKVEAIINSGLRRNEGPLIVLGCAPNDWHELGLLLIYLFMQRRGHNILYLGQNVPVAQFVEEMRRLSPSLVMISATTEDSLAGLIEMAQAVREMPSPGPVFGFGGNIFNARPELRDQVPGVFMGETARQALENVSQILAQRNK